MTSISYTYSSPTPLLYIHICTAYIYKSVDGLRPIAAVAAAAASTWRVGATTVSIEILFPSVLLQGLLPVLDVVRDDARRLVGREVAADGLDKVAFWVYV
jgi:hypothetical protein